MNIDRYNISRRIGKVRQIGFACLLLGASTGLAAEKTSDVPLVIGSFELSDQYDFTRKLAFPATNITVITVADKKGSAQVDSWVLPLANRYGERVAIAGIADVSTVPRLLRSTVQKQFKKRWSHTVMLDWEGTVVRRFHCRADEANVFVIDRQGRVTSCFFGAASSASLGALFHSVDLALSATEP